MRLQCGMYGPVKLGGESKGEKRKKRGSSSIRCGPLSVSFETYGSFDVCVRVRVCVCVLGLGYFDWIVVSYRFEFGFLFGMLLEGILLDH